MNQKEVAEALGKSLAMQENIDGSMVKLIASSMAFQLMIYRSSATKFVKRTYNAYFTYRVIVFGQKKDTES